MTEQVEVLQTIVDSLGETAERPRQQIQALIDLLGDQALLDVLAETDRVEGAGGMLLPDGSRRRTKGGVFFVLARRRLSRKDAKRIFGLANQEANPEGSEPSSRPDPKPKAVEPPRPLRRPRIVEVEELRGPGRVAVRETAVRETAVRETASRDAALRDVSPVVIARPKPNGFRPHTFDNDILPAAARDADSPRGLARERDSAPAAPAAAERVPERVTEQPSSPGGDGPDSSEPSSTKLVKLVRTGRRKIVPPPPPTPEPVVPAKSVAKAEKRGAGKSPRAASKVRLLPTPQQALDFESDGGPETARAPQASDVHRNNTARPTQSDRPSRRPAAEPAPDLFSQLTTAGARAAAAQVLGAAMSRLGPIGGPRTAAEKREFAKRSSLTASVANRTILDGIREEVFAAVADRLGLSRGQIANALYGKDDAATRRKVGGLFDGLGDKGKEVAVRLALAVMDT